ncbi:MAG: hypothetical protein HGJ94_17490 [Desulfosarcina sp.]|nr:hypothetical protein [Desulfosarcina sp.]MBC2743048.1 hypothetical protein [Desulfosarcina sp.]MBC2765958.1 hypothetical protein [Desulfosarcina sp.]
MKPSTRLDHEQKSVVISVDLILSEALKWDEWSGRFFYETGICCKSVKFSSIQVKENRFAGQEKNGGKNDLYNPFPGKCLKGRTVLMLDKTTTMAHVDVL